MSTATRQFAATACAIGALLFATGAAAQRPQDLHEAGWVSLYNFELLAILENENRLSELCPPAITDAQARSRCHREMLEEKTLRLILRSAPSERATAEGAIIVRATPGAGLRAFYQAADAEEPKEFVPDLFDRDWFYGPYFHQTFLERQGDWFLLPATPHHNAAWVNLHHVSSQPQVHLLAADSIVTSPQGDLMILGVERDHLRVRAEQPADLWCEEGNPPPLQPGTEFKLPVEELYTAEGHLTIAVKYMRGC